MKHGTNRLGLEKSPYLLEHATQPVDWYPWGTQAFSRAAEEGRPVFLSIGYASCHWCHVMAEESFADAEVARLLNESFVCVKVDRQERPDIDALYMRVCQMMTGSGGWPLTLLLTPERKPFFAATYVPRQSMAGRPGLVDLIPTIARAWDERRPEFEATADAVTAALREQAAGIAGEPLGEADARAAHDDLSRGFDEEHGGFGAAPRFPTPHLITFLLRHHRRTRDARSRHMATRTLDAWLDGGICDRVGGGFHRYATDAAWRIPHFEKMLCDQALMAIALLEAAAITGSERYRRTARQTLDYVLRDLATPEGAFASAEDADSEQGEGAFYLWGAEEIRRVLDPAEAGLVCEAFGITEEGNAAELGAGRNVLSLAAPLPALADRLGIELNGLEARIEAAMPRLFDERQQRPRPRRDDLVLTDWNGLAIAALARATALLGDEAYAEAAGRAAAFFTSRMVTADGRLWHRFRSGEPAVAGFADDYAFLIRGLLELAEVSSDARHLEAARWLHEALIRHHWDPAEGGLFLTADDAEPLPARLKECYDGAIPSANSVEMHNLLTLARLTGDASFAEKAQALGRAFAGNVRSMPSGFCHLLSAVDFGAAKA